MFYDKILKDIFFLIQSNVNMLYYVQPDIPRRCWCYVWYVLYSYFGRDFLVRLFDFSLSVGSFVFVYRRNVKVLSVLILIDSQFVLQL